MKASIVVLNHNSGPVLERCLGSLLALDADDYEVLLIDNDAAAADAVDELARAVSGTPLAPAVSKAAVAVASFDYDAALAALREVR